MITIKSFEKFLKIDDLKFEKSDKKSSFFYEEENKIDFKKSRQKSETEKFIDRLIAEALENRASDIHIEPFNNFFKIRYRIDGILIKIKELAIEYYPPILSRIKILCALDITERRVPQDGRFKINYKNQNYDLRVGIVPTYHGEKIVIRILDRTEIKKSLVEIGFNKEIYKNFFQILKRKNGMLLFTGPMGSGKTTSMYAVLNELNKEEINITTIEDPVEYSLLGVNQIQCQEDIGLSFANILKGILRQDTDIIMIGEIRDKETAKIALRASLTGHLVISTLHTNSASRAIKRLLDLDIEDYIISAGIKGIQNQRLIRKLCPHCKKIDINYNEKLKILKIDSKEFNNVFYTHSGCEKCNGTGYKDRIMIGEFLFINENISEQIEKGASIREIEKAGEKNGMIPLIKVGIQKAILGITSLDEIIREC